MEARSDVAVLGGGGTVVGDRFEGMLSDGGVAIEGGGAVRPAVREGEGDGAEEEVALTVMDNF